MAQIQSFMDNGLITVGYTGKSGGRPVFLQGRVQLSNFGDDFHLNGRVELSYNYNRGFALREPLPVGVNFPDEQIGSLEFERDKLHRSFKGIPSVVVDQDVEMGTNLVDLLRPAASGAYLELYKLLTEKTCEKILKQCSKVLG